jgi:hypothetical protein
MSIGVILNHPPTVVLVESATTTSKVAIRADAS